MSKKQKRTKKRTQQEKSGGKALIHLEKKGCILMATIKENKKNGKTVSYRFTVCLERDIRGKQIREYTTWKPDEGLTPSKARKAAERAADAWEQEVRAEYQKKKALGQACAIPVEKRRGDFTAFVNDAWLPLQVRGGNDKRTTVAFYEHMAHTIQIIFKTRFYKRQGRSTFKSIWCICAHSTKAG